MERSLEILHEQQGRLWTMVSRLMAGLMLVQWAGCVLLALLVSPLTWIGEQHRVHEHVWAAAVIGGLLASLPCLLALAAPTAAATRHVIAAAQVLFSALLI